MITTGVLCLHYYTSKDIYFSVTMFDDKSISIAKNIYMDIFNTDIYKPLDEELQHFVSFKKYEDADERKKYFDYQSELLTLYLCTKYLDNLPKAYTFILSSSSTKTFCRDITKLIAHKILFFIFQEKIKFYVR